MPDNKTTVTNPNPPSGGAQFNDSLRQQIYDNYIEMGVKPEQAYMIASTPDAIYLTADALYVLGQVVTDESGNFVLNTTYANDDPANQGMGQYGTIRDMTTYMATDEGAVQATQLYADQTEYDKAYQGVTTFQDRYDDAIYQQQQLTKYLNDYFLQQEAMDEQLEYFANHREEYKNSDGTLTDEGLRLQQILTNLNDLNQVNSTINELNTESEIINKWGITDVNGEKIQTARPLLNRMASNYGDKGMRDKFGNYGYLSQDDLKWGEQKIEEENLAKKTEEATKKAYELYLGQGGQLSRAVWEKAGRPTGGNQFMEGMSSYDVVNRNANSQQGSNYQNWLRNSYSDIYSDFNAQDINSAQGTTENDAIKWNLSKNARFENYLKENKQFLYQKYKGINPYQRGDETSRLAPRVRVLSY